MSGKVLDMYDRSLYMYGRVLDISIAHLWIHDQVIDMYGKVLDMSGTCRGISTVELGTYIGAICPSNQTMCVCQNAW